MALKTAPPTKVAVDKEEKALRKPSAERFLRQLVGTENVVRKLSYMKLTYLLLTLGFFWAAGCSIFMEATRPTPVDLDKFKVGETRDSIRQRLGAPDQSVIQSDGTNCDNYRIYTKGYGAGGKAGVAILEGAADVMTLGLTEVVLTPTEALTKNERHPVAFCYSSGKLLTVKRELLTNSIPFHKQTVVPQSNKPGSMSSALTVQHASEPAISKLPAAAPPFPPTVIVPAS
jgi:hypothetical protein